jgi:hypothetical protein
MRKSGIWPSSPFLRSARIRRYTAARSLVFRFTRVRDGSAVHSVLNLDLDSKRIVAEDIQFAFSTSPLVKLPLRSAE